MVTWTLAGDDGRGTTYLYHTGVWAAYHGDTSYGTRTCCFAGNAAAFLASKTTAGTCYSRPIPTSIPFLPSPGLRCGGGGRAW